ncbi:hypothetical protein [Macrococcus armenti]|uniref:hypothetical protein n=1 Tax=Macrococcus armenti TaxID=2875764 RepID=UPI001CCB9CCD|nr:hypothetical protein [Macrococcus armenti]UBH16609.1 hypothetical protein LAU44_11905 [Macrococcus armenti]UBH21243.1 hypothetical protein LAU40_11940 [Macrococcus armenti]
MDILMLLSTNWIPDAAQTKDLQYKVIFGIMFILVVLFLLQVVLAYYQQKR